MKREKITAKITRFTGENEFKSAFLASKLDKRKVYIFNIETEETVKGFPDTLILSRSTGQAYFIEFKFTVNGRIKFQASQIAFYKKHKDMQIYIVAYDRATSMYYQFCSNDIFRTDKLTDSNTVKLEELWNESVNS